MNLSHDEMAMIVANVLLKNFREEFGNVFISPVISDFPRPDFVFLPLSSVCRRSFRRVYYDIIKHGSSAYPTAFEFKTPYVHKHEYIMGVGQAIAYNSTFPCSYLIVPKHNIEGFNVELFIHEIISKNSLYIGLIVYDPENIEKVNIVKKADVRKVDIESIETVTTGVKRSYAYWRETKPEEVYAFLRIAYDEYAKKREKSGEIQNLKGTILKRLWREVLSKRFKQAKRERSFLLNYDLFFSHLGLWDRWGVITTLGRYTLLQGERFGENSKTFRDIITYLLLRYGGHYTLLKYIYTAQLKAPYSVLKDWQNWIQYIHKELSQRGYYISNQDFRVDLPRLPYAYSKYFSGIVDNPPFEKGKGLKINWPIIIQIIEKGRAIFQPIEVE